MSYFVCSILALCFMVLYIIGQVAVIIDRDGGIKIEKAIRCICFTLFGIIGFACWWGLTGASYDADCKFEDWREDLLDGDKPEMCAGSGATMSIIAFLATLTAGIFGVIEAFVQTEVAEIKYSQEATLCCKPKIH